MMNESRNAHMHVLMSSFSWRPSHEQIPTGMNSIPGIHPTFGTTFVHSKQTLVILSNSQDDK